MPSSILFSRLNSSLSFSSCSKCSKPLNIIVDLQWPCTSMCLLSWRGHQWAEYSRSVSPGLSRGNGHPSQPAGNFYIIQSRMLLTFFAARTHCWFMSSLPTKFPRAFSAKLLSSWFSAFTAEWGYSSSGVGLGTCICWASWDSCSHVSSACQGPSEWQHNPQVYQTLLPVLYHLLGMLLLYLWPTTINLFF